MKEYSVEICPYWNGGDKVCDAERCKKILDANDWACYHKPITIDYERQPLAVAIAKLIRENRGMTHVQVNGQQVELIQAIDDIVGGSIK